MIIVLTEQVYNMKVNDILWGTVVSSPIYTLLRRETKLFTRRIQVQIGKDSTTSKENGADFLRGITFHPSISSFPQYLLSIFRQKIGKRSVGNGHQKSYSRADIYQSNKYYKYYKSSIFGL